MTYKKFFKGKKVLITGHTGFKGSWLALWMKLLGANVIGVSKDIPTIPSHISSINLSNKIKNIKINLSNLKKIKKIIVGQKPDFIFHLAAQSLVKKSYLDTIETWQSNCIGTINLLESLRSLNKKIFVVLVTSDKSYKNIETKRGYKENDILGGVDPYGASKSAAEIAINSYIKSFFPNNGKVKISIARAGNVIGGGDWSSDRLVPDCVKSWSKNKRVNIRSPYSTRPWQHVLEAIHGYIRLSVKLSKNSKLHGQAFNFGPNQNTNYKVIDLVKEMRKNWHLVKFKNFKKNNKFFENKLLSLNSSKARKILNWKCILRFEETIFLTIDWYKNFYEKNISNYHKSSNQVKFYNNLLKKRLLK